nr:uncharacterized protein LOC111515086 [Leptinotarsa decemlineata]
MAATQRKMLLRVAAGYRTISAAAVNVITGVPPIDMLVRGRGRLDALDQVTEADKRLQRSRTIEEWQTSWEDNTRMAQWTKRLIPNLRPWLERDFKYTSYYITQALSGHGFFKTYTCRIGKADDEVCLYCQEMDSPEHTLFSFNRWQRERNRYETETGEKMSSENSVNNMMKSRENWK